jgi:hypothetical protein
MLPTAQAAQSSGSRELLWKALYNLMIASSSLFGFFIFFAVGFPLKITNFFNIHELISTIK